ncbi:hypothetical protein LQG66_03895 [Bradyrhizobium ontarionense]|uniref:Uncharacterized protein n=1 Tax=Bradyrhizobium ontarionense TaxID=2898149 RepID=A0ABY3RDF8_9BRAD|nr:hypothetical protein [Bradyrhizobium sp. A19]UFZ05469.1 hypothetical protein LQG66_03895 [Bradyrhizobium sp. A19]
MRRLCIPAGLVCLLLLSIPAQADWTIASHKDRLTDKETRTASLSARQPDHGIAARLTVHCLDHELVGGLIISIETAATFTRGRMGLRFRVDDSEAQLRFMPVNAQGNGMAQWTDPEDLRGARRLRVELEPARSPNLFYEFDLAGVDKALDRIPCTRTRS